jgi:hypothetical protein
VDAGRFEAAIAAIDAANADDPHTLVIEGVERRKEQAHAELMTHWVTTLAPDADEAQLLAARAHHLRRWTSPRSSYPEGRAGYLRWRTDLKRRHAEDVGSILTDCGYDEEVVDRVQRIIRKENLRSDPAVQVHEDALCLVFLSTQLAPVGEQLGEDKSVEVLRKTLAKMSERGRQVAMQLELSPAARSLLVRAAST